jgi:hypothetical protein
VEGAGPILRGCLAVAVQQAIHQGSVRCSFSVLVRHGALLVAVVLTGPMDTTMTQRRM